MANVDIDVSNSSSCVLLLLGPSFRVNDTDGSASTSIDRYSWLLVTNNWHQFELYSPVPEDFE